MDRLEKLEKQWLFYKTKQILKRAAVVAAAVLVGGVVVYLSLYKSTQNSVEVQKEITEETKPAPMVEEKAVLPTLSSKEYEIARSSSPLILEPDFSFEKEIKNRGVVATKQAPVEQKTSIISKVTSLQALEDGFDSNPSYAKAIEIATAYREQNNNSKALKWALKANEIDSSEESSWEIYAVASSNLGRKEQAIKALKAFLAVKPSKRLADLLKEMEER